MLDDDRPMPGMWLLAMGVLFPLFVTVLELATGLCAEMVFDPLPTWGHVAVVLAVPAINFLLWRAARRSGPEPRWLMVAGGAAAAVAGAYTLLFLPLLPISLIGIIFAIGLLPQAPPLALVASLKLTGALVVEGTEWRRWLGGVLAGLLALTVVDLPATATYVALRWTAGDEDNVRRGTALMRAAGDESMLLRLCYGDSGRSTGLVSFVVSSWNEGLFEAGPVTTTAAARELYYRSTGRAFNTVAPPRRGTRRGGLFSFDEDQGGEAVGGRAQGLALTSSRLDGSVSAADNVAYLEWTASFENRSAAPHEARLTLALPAGAVASRATLWVNGVPREASVAGRGAARAAYQGVVVARRDPLLVTTAGAGRLLVQAFPVQPGVPLKLRIGLSAPLEIGSDGSRSLALPAIAERNFEVPPGLRHQLWFEGGRPNVVRAAIDDARLGARPRIRADRIEAPSLRVARLPALGRQPALTVAQTIERGPAPRPASLTLLVDGSEANRAAAAGLLRAMEAIPAGLPVALAIAGEQPRGVAMAPWSPEQRRRVAQAIADTAFTGGQDNIGPLTEALDRAGGADSVLLWIHGPQPIDFVRSRARLEPILERRRDLPRLVRYQAAGGAAFAMPGEAWFERAREAVPSGDVAGDLAALFAELGGAKPVWRVTRAPATAAAGEAASIHIARLWGAESSSAAGPREREAAIALARRLNIVTPLSGAVVLENDADYKAAGLAVPDAAEVPTVPEPATWALLAMVAAILAALLRRRRRQAASA